MEPAQKYWNQKRRSDVRCLGRRLVSLARRPFDFWESCSKSACRALQGSFEQTPHPTFTSLRPRRPSSATRCCSPSSNGAELSSDARAMNSRSDFTLCKVRRRAKDILRRGNISAVAEASRRKLDMHDTFRHWTAGLGHNIPVPAGSGRKQLRPRDKRLYLFLRAVDIRTKQPTADARIQPTSQKFNTQSAAALMSKPRPKDKRTVYVLSNKKGFRHLAQCQSSQKIQTRLIPFSTCSNYSCAYS